MWEHQDLPDNVIWQGDNIHTKKKRVILDAESLPENDIFKCCFRLYLSLNTV